jgi:signal transduction histidine kinase
VAYVAQEAIKRLETMTKQYHAKIISQYDWPQATGYGPWIETIWVNYLSNAIKYGGEPPVIELGADSAGNGMVRYWIKDNGNGLTENDQSKLFTPFTRLNELRVQGYGVGLSIVKRAVEKLGGQVGVESKVGQGSLFYFTLPAHTPPKNKPS